MQNPWFGEYVMSFDVLTAQTTTFAITDTKFYVPVVALWTHTSAKMFEKLKSGFKRTINWNKYHPKK